MSIYSIPPLITAILTLIVGTIVLVKGRKLAYALITAAVFVWLSGYSLMYSTGSYSFALLLTRFVYVGVLLIPDITRRCLNYLGKCPRSKHDSVFVPSTTVSLYHSFSYAWLRPDLNQKIGSGHGQPLFLKVGRGLIYYV